MPWECLGNLSSQPCPQAPGSHLGKLRHRRGDLACSEMLIPSVTGSSNPGTGTGQTGGTEQTGDKQLVSPAPLCCPACCMAGRCRAQHRATAGARAAAAPSCDRPQWPRYPTHAWHGCGSAKTPASAPARPRTPQQCCTPCSLSARCTDGPGCSYRLTAGSCLRPSPTGDFGRDGIWVDSEGVQS